MELKMWEIGSTYQDTKLACELFRMAPGQFPPGQLPLDNCPWTITPQL